MRHVMASLLFILFAIGPCCLAAHAADQQMRIYQTPDGRMNAPIMGAKSLQAGTASAGFYVDFDDKQEASLFLVLQVPQAIVTPVAVSIDLADSDLVNEQPVHPAAKKAQVFVGFTRTFDYGRHELTLRTAGFSGTASEPMGFFGARSVSLTGEYPDGSPLALRGTIMSPSHLPGSSCKYQAANGQDRVQVNYVLLGYRPDSNVNGTPVGPQQFYNVHIGGIYVTAVNQDVKLALPAPVQATVDVDADTYDAWFTKFQPTQFQIQALDNSWTPGNYYDAFWPRTYISWCKG